MVLRIGSQQEEIELKSCGSITRHWLTKHTPITFRLSLKMSHYFELPNAMQGAAEPDFASNNHTKHLVLDWIMPILPSEFYPIHFIIYSMKSNE